MRVSRINIQPQPMTADCIDELMAWVEHCQTVTQAADQRIQRLIGDACHLLLSPHDRDKVAAPHHLTLPFI